MSYVFLLYFFIFRENNKEIADLPLFINSINPQEKAGLYSFSRILAKNELVCSQYNSEMKSLLNESEEVMSSLYRIATAIFVLAPFCFFCLIATLGEEKNVLVTEIINILIIHLIFFSWLAP